jgi:opacity protein-like surface antigen
MKSSATLAALAVALALSASLVSAQSPSAQTAVTIGGKTLSIQYSAPSVRHRKIFGPGGLLSQDPTYPAWRAGANSSTAFHTDAPLDVGGLQVPKGDYTIYVWVADPDNWLLIINKQTGQWGLDYNAKMDLGRVKMTMSKPPAPIETYKMTLSATGPKTGKLQLEWENHIASVPITLK